MSLFVAAADDDDDDYYYCYDNDNDNNYGDNKDAIHLFVIDYVRTAPAPARRSACSVAERARHGRGRPQNR